MYAHAVRNERTADQMAEIKGGDVTAHGRHVDDQQASSGSDPVARWQRFFSGRFHTNLVWGASQDHVLSSRTCRTTFHPHVEVEVGFRPDLHGSRWDF